MTTAVNFPDLSAGGTVFVVAKQSNVNGATNLDTGGVFIGSIGAGNMEIKRGNISTGGLASIRAAIDAFFFLDTTAVVADDTFITIRLRNDGISNYLSVNDAAEISGDSDGDGYVAAPLTVFKTAADPQGNKQIAEIIIYSRSLTTDELNYIEDYLQDKYDHF